MNDPTKIEVETRFVRLLTGPYTDTIVRLPDGRSYYSRQPGWPAAEPAPSRLMEEHHRRQAPGF